MVFVGRFLVTGPFGAGVVLDFLPIGIPPYPVTGIEGMHPRGYLESVADSEGWDSAFSDKLAVLLCEAWPACDDAPDFFLVVSDFGADWAVVLGGVSALVLGAGLEL